MPVPFSNMEDIVYCHNEELAKEIFELLREKGYSVGFSGSVITTGTHGEQVVKRLDVFKKNNDKTVRSDNRFHCVDFNTPEQFTCKCVYNECNRVRFNEAVGDTDGNRF